MKINEVEQLVGVTRRNIRFYEKEGLLAPGRDSSNGYRNYTDEDVEVLRKIKLFRKLDLPLEEIRALQDGRLTVRDAMGRHIIQLGRQRANLEAMSELCRELEQDGAQLATLDTERYLRSMEEREQEGTKFVNVKKKDAPAKYTGAVIAALVMVALMAGLIALFVWAFTVDPADAPPLPLLIFILALPSAVIVGVFIALVQRFKQIKGGEEDAAAQY